MIELHGLKCGNRKADIVEAGIADSWVQIRQRVCMEKDGTESRWR